MKNETFHLLLASAGSYPRTGRAPEMRALNHTVKAYESGERTTADLVDAQNAMARRAISDQVAAGLDIVTDGQVRWIDPISHFAGELDNVRLDGAHAFFGTSQKYRQPILTGRPLRRRSLIAHEYSFARNALGQLPTPKGKAGKLSIKPVLTGPYTLAKLSSAEAQAYKTAETYHSLEHRVEAFADALAGEIKALIEAGADLVQIDEPAAVAFPGEFFLVAAGLAALIAARDAMVHGDRRPALALYLYFGDCTPLFEKLQELPVDLLGLDFSSSPELLDAVTSAGSSKPLALGLVNGRNPCLEDASTIARQVERILARISAGRSHLGTSCGLGFLSHSHANAKLSLLRKIQKSVVG
jgi:5-methyltetrahydropteroyltriglutamate--homocysteine methyltransferase